MYYYRCNCSIPGCKTHPTGKFPGVTVLFQDVSSIPPENVQPFLCWLCIAKKEKLKIKSAKINCFFEIFKESLFYQILRMFSKFIDTVQAGRPKYSRIVCKILL